MEHLQEIPKSIELKFRAFVRNLSQKWSATMTGYDKASKTVTGEVTPTNGDSIDGFTIEVNQNDPYVFITNTYGEKGEYNFEEGVHYINSFAVEESDYSSAKVMDVKEKEDEEHAARADFLKLDRIGEALKKAGIKCTLDKSSSGYYRSLVIESRHVACIATVSNGKATATIVKDGKVSTLSERKVNDFVDAIKTIL